MPAPESRRPSPSSEVGLNREAQSDRKPSPESSEAKDAGREALENYEILAERLKLKEQYLSQVKVLRQSGLLEMFPPTLDHPLPEIGVVGVDGQKHFPPKYEDILSRLKDPEQGKLIEQKVEQGFTKLQLVPFALPLSQIIERYKKTLLTINKDSGIKATDGSTLELNTEDPLFVWDFLTLCDRPDTPQDKQMEYEVKNYDGKTKEARGGKWKTRFMAKINR